MSSGHSNIEAELNAELKQECVALNDKVYNNIEVIKNKASALLEKAKNETLDQCEINNVKIDAENVIGFVYAILKFLPK